MTLDDLAHQIREGILAGKDWMALRALLVAFEQAGGSQDGAYRLIDGMRAAYDEAQEAVLLDLLDLVSGFCGSELRVWKSAELADPDPSG